MDDEKKTTKKQAKETAVPEFGITVELSLSGDDFVFVQWHGSKPQRINFRKEKLQSMIELLLKIQAL